MSSRFSQPDYSHAEPPRTGVLLTNLGTPDAPTPAALRRYLGEFLWDPRVVELPRPLWWLILHGIILRTRPKRSAHAYAQVWTRHGSPLLHISQQQAAAVQAHLEQHWGGPLKLALGMRYGQPSIAQGLEELRQAGVRRLLVLPLYPQYSSATTGSTFDAVSAVLRTWRWLPELGFIPHYHDHPAYIRALAASVRAYWDAHGEPEKLLLSFHGIPKRTFLAGDPYHCECHKTARLLAESLGLAEPRWQVVFQSRFGREEWLQPYTDHTLQALGRAGCKRVDLVCPGFAADCLETLEEIAMQNKALFQQAGGGDYHYIPALNTDPAHIHALGQVLLERLAVWPQTPAAELAQAAAATEGRARALGAGR